MSRPRVSDVTWRLIYSKNGLEVYSDKDNPWVYFRVKLNGSWVNRFYGETAWMDVNRYVHDQAMEFWDFDIDQIYDKIVKDAIEELSKR